METRLSRAVHDHVIFSSPIIVSKNSFACPRLQVIRVWSLKSTQPIAVLQGHTGMITSLQVLNIIALY